MLQSDFLIVIGWKISDLARWCSNHSLQHAMYLKNEMQRALATYAKRNKVDAVQHKAIAIIAKLEKWTRDAFVKREMRSIVNGAPGLATRLATIKSMAREAWETYNRKESY